MNDHLKARVVGGRLESSSPFFASSRPTKWPDFVINGPDLPLLLSHPDEVQVTDETIKVGSNVEVKRQAPVPALVKPVALMQPPPPLLSPKLTLLHSFCDHSKSKRRELAQQVHLTPKAMVASNGSCSLCMSAKTPQISLHRDVIRHILRMGAEVCCWGLTEKGLLVEFADTSWIEVTASSSLPSFRPAGTVTSSLPLITDEYRKSFLDFLFQAQSNANRSTGKRKGSRVRGVVAHLRYLNQPVRVLEAECLWETSTIKYRAPVKTPGARGAFFGSKDLQVILQVATRIDFSQTPVPFTTGFGGRGMLLEWAS